MVDGVPGLFLFDTGGVIDYVRGSQIVCFP